MRATALVRNFSGQLQSYCLLQSYGFLHAAFSPADPDMEDLPIVLVPG